MAPQPASPQELTPISRVNNSNDSIEFFRLCLSDRVLEEVHICAENWADPLATRSSDDVYDILDQLADNPDSFLFVAGTTHSDFSCAHMYSLLGANSREVTLANPHETQIQAFSLNYESFIEQFRRLAGVKLISA